MPNMISPLPDWQVLLASGIPGHILTQKILDLLVSAIPTGRTATKVVKANNSDAQWLGQSDYQCDGTADDEEMNAAINALP